MKRSLAFLSLAICLNGCSTSGLPNTGDGGPDNDGSATADLASSKCGDVLASIASWLAAHSACATDEDCTSMPTGCGTPGVCGAYMNRSAPGPYLDSLLAYWGTSCATHCGVFCPVRPMAACNAGRCGERAAGAIGASCSSVLDCASGVCLIDPMRYPGGYCSAACGPDFHDGCPSGSVCRGDGTGGAHCFATCDPNAKKSDCRAGYSCCGVGGPSDMGVACVPFLLCGA